MPAVASRHRFLVDCLDRIPETLGREFLFSHVHTYDPPGKTLLQGVDEEMAVRVDVFRAYVQEMDRAEQTWLAGFPIRVVSLPDLVARHARLTWDLVGGKTVAPKYARDFQCMLDGTTTDEVEAVWQEHRKPHSPEGFAETARELRRVIEIRKDLLVPTVYSKDTLAACSRCTAFQHSLWPMRPGYLRFWGIAEGKARKQGCACARRIAPHLFLASTRKQNGSSRRSLRLSPRSGFPPHEPKTCSWGPRGLRQRGAVLRTVPLSHSHDTES